MIPEKLSSSRREALAGLRASTAHYLRRIIWTALACTALAARAAPVPAEGTHPGPGQRPNFLLIVADDLGYSDIGAYGGEIHTPRLDRLAKHGMKFTDFYVSPTCSPTRAMLLTGNDSHVSGLGTMAEALRPEQRGRPGYEGYLNQSVATIAERLKGAGYFTAMVGKWHLGGRPGQIPAERGFDRSFALINGAANYYGKDQGGAWAGTLFQARYFEDDKPGRLPEGAYTTDYFTTRLIGFLNRTKDSSNQPFFAYLAFNAPHTPLQAPADLVEKYDRVYADGPVSLRQQRVRRMQAMGLIPEGGDLPAMIDVRDWASLTDAERLASSRRMQIYAAAVDRMDQNIGRILDALRDSGRLDNTYVIVLSDNGAEGTDEDYWLGFLAHLGMPPALARQLHDANADIARVGSADSYAAYGPGWAQAGMAPFRLTKGFTNEGGIRAPLIISGPGIGQDRTARSVAHVMDIVPTVLELAGAPTAAVIDGRQVLPPQGESLAGLLHGGASDTDNPRSLGWELFGRRAVRQGQWKAVYMNQPSVARGSGTGAAHWQLFDLARDPGETTDLAGEHPDTLRELEKWWESYEVDNGVIAIPPLGDRGKADRPAPPRQ